MDPYKTKIYKNGRFIKRTHLLYIDSDHRLCDGCDEEKEFTASMSTISGGVECICRDCLKSFVKAFDEIDRVKLEDRKETINKILDK